MTKNKKYEDIEVNGTKCTYSVKYDKGQGRLIGECWGGSNIAFNPPVVCCGENRKNLLLQLTVGIQQALAEKARK